MWIWEVGSLDLDPKEGTTNKTNNPAFNYDGNYWTYFLCQAGCSGPRALHRWGERRPEQAEILWAGQAAWRRWNLNSASKNPSALVGSGLGQSAISGSNNTNNNNSYISELWLSPRYPFNPPDILGRQELLFTSFYKWRKNKTWRIVVTLG